MLAAIEYDDPAVHCVERPLVDECHAVADREGRIGFCSHASMTAMPSRIVMLVAFPAITQRGCVRRFLERIGT